MFDYRLPEPDTLGRVGTAALVDAMAECARAEAAAAARRLAVIGEFTDRRLSDAAHPDWACDDWDAAAVEVGAALNLTLGRAGTQMTLAMTLRTRLPRVAAALAAGAVSLWVVTEIAARTDRVVDRDTVAVLDAKLAEHAVTWGLLSRVKLHAAIDLWVSAVDPAAVHRSRRTARDREVGFGDPNDGDGITSIWGQVLATDAKLLQARLTAMARGVCDADPRTLAQRRADALGALGAGSWHLQCACTRPDCTASADDGRATHIVVHVLTDAAVDAAAPDPQLHGEHPPYEPIDFATAVAEYRARTTTPAATDEPATESTDPETPTADPADPTPAASPPRQCRPGVTVGGPVLPGPLLADLIARGATIDTLTTPAAQPHRGYRPPTPMDTWVRSRDLTCRAPGCDRPAATADLDHTLPWPAGPTHPSGLKAYCRKHHLAKTFWPGFTDRQHPDGRIEFTTPTGHTYTTHPLGALLFPGWNTTTPPLPDPAATPPPAATGTLMPKRKRTRTQEHTSRINTERKHNTEHNLPPPF